MRRESIQCTIAPPKADRQVGLGVKAAEKPSASLAPSRINELAFLSDSIQSLLVPPSDAGMDHETQ